MKLTTTASLALALTVCAPLLLGSSSALAQAYPNKPITMIVPWPAGGSTDRHLRTLADLASKHLGQNIVVQNQPGGGGTLGRAIWRWRPSLTATPLRSIRWACCAFRTCRKRCGTR